MPTFLVQSRFPSETWARLMKKPEDRETTLRKSVEALGGKLHAFYFAFGDNDAYAVIEVPDNKTMMAGAIVSASAGISTRTVALISSSEAKKAMQLAQDTAANYTPPGGKPKKK